MNTNHAACGMIAGLATLPATHLHHGWQQIVYVLLWAGCASLCDWDHHNSSPTRMWGPISQLLTAPLRWLPGGHRWATHDLVLAPLSGAAITWALLHLTTSLAALAQTIAHHLHAPHELISALPLLVTLTPIALLVGVSLKMTVLPRGSSALLNLACSFAAAWWITTHPASQLIDLVPLAVAGGMAVHILGDAVTIEKVPVPIVWIFTRTRIGLPLFEVGGSVERLVIGPALGLAVLWFAWPQLPADIRHDLVTLTAQTRQALAAVLHH